MRKKNLKSSGRYETIWNFPCFQQTWLNFAPVYFLGIFRQLDQNNLKLEKIRVFVWKFLFHQYSISHIISVKIQFYSNHNANITKHVGSCISLDSLHVSMGTCRSKTYKCGFVQCPVSISCLLDLSFKIQVAFARVCYCDFSIVTHHVTILESKDCYAFCLWTKTLSFFTNHSIIFCLYPFSYNRGFTVNWQQETKVFTDEIFCTPSFYW